MVKVPSFILKKLYTKGSLKNIDDGFQFEIKNVLADATIISPMNISVDDSPIDSSKIILKSPEGEVPSNDISINNSILFKVKTKVTVIVKGISLPPGEHRIHISTKTKEYGPVEFEIKDKIE